MRFGISQGVGRDQPVKRKRKTRCPTAFARVVVWFDTDHSDWSGLVRAQLVAQGSKFYIRETLVFRNAQVVLEEWEPA